MQASNQSPPESAQLPDASALVSQMNERYRNELLVHCYRILGSVEDAEDALQETFLRAWRHLDTLRVPSSLRAWLYKIATNAALDMLAKRKPRLMPSVTHPPSDPSALLSEPSTEPLWLDPLPESLLAADASHPEQQYELHEKINLAFLTILQRLPGRQRAVLILCDVMEWKPQEAAEMLETSIAAVNSTLQRARATLKKYHQDSPTAQTTSNSGSAATLDRLLTQYMQAWETADSKLLTTLLRDDCVLTMPPVPTWFRGRTEICTFLDRVVFADFVSGSVRLIPTRSNGSPAFALYQRDPAGDFRLQALHVLSIENHLIVRIDDFLAVNERLFQRFRLPRPT